MRVATLKLDELVILNGYLKFSLFHNVIISPLCFILDIKKLNSTTAHHWSLSRCYEWMHVTQPPVLACVLACVLAMVLACVYLLLQLRLRGVDGFVHQQVAGGAGRSVPADPHGDGGLVEHVHVRHGVQGH